MSLFMNWLQQLPEDDLMRLLKFASKWHWLECCGGPAPADLVQEALLRYLEGRRKMPPDSAFDKRLVWVYNTIKSIASHAWEALHNQPSSRDPVAPVDEEEISAAIADGPAGADGTEDRNQEQELIQQLGIPLVTPTDRPRQEPTSCLPSVIELDSPERITIGQELEQCLRWILQHRPRHADVLELKLQGYSHTEIAHTLGLCNARVTQLIDEIRHQVLDFYQHNT